MVKANNLRPTWHAQRFIQCGWRCCRSQDLYPIDVEEYELKHVIGKGASATVSYSPQSQAFHAPCAYICSHPSGLADAAEMHTHAV